VLNSFQEIVALLNQISSTRTNGAEIRMQATGLLREISEQSFLFMAKLIYKVSAKLIYKVRNSLLTLAL